MLRWVIYLPVSTGCYLRSLAWIVLVPDTVGHAACALYKRCDLPQVLITGGNRVWQMLQQAIAQMVLADCMKQHFSTGSLSPSAPSCTCSLGKILQLSVSFSITTACKYMKLLYGKGLMCLMAALLATRHVQLRMVVVLLSSSNHCEYVQSISAVCTTAVLLVRYPDTALHFSNFTTAWQGKQFCKAHQYWLRLYHDCHCQLSLDTPCTKQQRARLHSWQ